MVFHDDFSSPQIAPSWWPQSGTHVIGDCEEDQWYVPENCFIRDGKLILEAKKEDHTPPGKQLKHFTSGSVGLNTHFGHCYLEGRIKINTLNPKGFWPAFWLFSGGVTGDNPAYLELDIFEYYGKVYDYNFTSHYGPDIGNGHTKDTDWAYPDGSSREFHKYAVEWTPTHTRYFLDDQLLGSYPFPPSFQGKNIYLQLLMNGAVGCLGGNPWNGTFPNELEIDYIKIFQKDEDIAHIESIYPLPSSSYGRGYKVCVNEENTFVIPNFPGTIVNFSGIGLNVSSTTVNAFFDHSRYSKITGGGMFKSCKVTAPNPGVYMLRVTVTAADGHTTSDDIHLEVLSTPSTPTQITATKTSCNEYIVEVPFQSGANYIWSLDGIPLFPAGNSITMTAPYYGTISVSAASYNGCSSGQQYSENVNLFTYYPECNNLPFAIPKTNTNTLAKANKTSMVKTPSTKSSETGLDLSISPNPFKNEISIELKDKIIIDENIEVELIDILGKIHLKQAITVGNNTLITNDLSNGIYFLKTIKNGQVQSQYIKLIKTN